MADDFDWNSLADAEPKKTGEWDDLVSSPEEDRVQKVKETQTRAKDIDPARQAKALEVGKAKGMPAEVAYENLDELTKTEYDWESLAKESPATADLMGDPQKGPITQGDQDALGGMEKSLKWAASKYLWAGKKLFSQPVRETLMLGGNLTPEQGKIEQQKIVDEALAAKMAAKEARDQALKTERIRREERAAVDPNYKLEELPALEDSLTGFTARQDYEPVNEALTEAIRTPPTLTEWATKTDNFLGSISGGVATSVEGYGGLWDTAFRMFPQLKVVDFTDEDKTWITQLGERMGGVNKTMFPGDKARADDFMNATLPQAFGSLVTFMGIGSAFKAAGLGTKLGPALFGSFQGAGGAKQDAEAFGATATQTDIAKLVGAAAGLLEYIPIDEFFSALERAGGRSFARTMFDALRQGGLEAGQEGVQSLPSDVYARMTYDPNRDILGNLSENMLAGGITGATIGALGSLSSPDVEDNQKRLLSLRDFVAQSKTNKVAPEVVREHLRKAAETGNVPPTVTASLEAVETLLQELDPEAREKAFPGHAAAIQEARTAGVEVSIPVENLAALSQLKGYEVFTEDVRIQVDVSTDAFTPKEKKQAQKDIEKFLEEFDTQEPPVPAGMVRVYHSGAAGEGETGRWVSTNRQYAADYRGDLPLFYVDLPENDPRITPDEWNPEQGVKQGFTFNFELKPDEAARLQKVSRERAQDPEQRPIFKNVYDQLVKAGQAPDAARVQARLYDAFFTTQAERSGKDPNELMKRYGFEVAFQESSTVPQGAMEQGQGIKVYRGSTAQETADGRGDFDGVFTSTDRDSAAQYGEVTEYSLPADTKILDMGDLDPSGTTAQLIRAYLVGQGEEASTLPQTEQELDEWAPDLHMLDNYEGWTDFVRGFGYQATQMGPDIRVLDRNLLQPASADTTSPAFKAWFGDSKVVDKKGAPRVMYHGTGKTFTEFGPASFFTDDRESAEWYSENRSDDGVGRIEEVYLSVQNPLDARTKEGAMEFIALARRAGAEITFTDSQYGWTFETDEIGKHSPYDGTNLNDLIYSPRIREQMKKEGYDGLLAYDQLGRDEIEIFVPLDPTQIKSVNNRGTFDPDNPNILMQAADGEAVEQFRASLNPREQALINPIYTDKVPPQKLKGNEEAARWLESHYSGTPITDLTAQIDDAILREIGNVMAAEAIYAMERSGNAYDWYTSAMQRALQIVSVKWPMLADDAAAADAGFGTASNARFVFTYIMAVTSQNLDVAANAVATNKAFDEMLARVKAGNFTMSRSWGTGDKRAAMADNFSKFGPLIKAMRGNSFAGSLTLLDNLFRQSMKVSEWVREMKADGVPYNPPGQTAMDAVVYGSSLLGPKIGNGFWQNLNGNFNPLTIDLWMRRTWGRLTGKSIGNEASLPAQRARLKASILRSIKSPERDLDALLPVLQEQRAINAELRALADRTDITKKEKAAETRRLKARIRVLKDVAADLRGIPAPEGWKKIYDTDNAALAAYAKRLLGVWNKEYKRLREKYPGGVPAKAQPTWARGAKRLKADLTTPLDQVANGTQRRQIEAAVRYAQQTLADLGYNVTTADLQAILWYPEKELWGALTTALAVDEDGDPVIPPSPLNESYDTAFARILKDEGYETQQGTEGSAAGRGDQRAVSGRDAAGSGPGGSQDPGVPRPDGAAAAAEKVGTTLLQTAQPQRRTYPQPSDPLTQPGPWRDAEVMAVDEMGNPTPVNAGDAVDFMVTRIQSMWQLLECVNAD